MISTNYFEAGQEITLRGPWHGKPWWAGPARVVVDSQDLIALYWPAGSISRIPTERTTARDYLSGRDPELVERAWTGTDVLALNTPGEAHSIWVMWEAGTKDLRCWYVNLEEPLRRTSIGFDSMDHLLDIVISPDKSTWRWKDEDEFEGMIQTGVFSPTQAAAIRAEGVRVIHQLETNASPFCDGWEQWSPPTSWTIPVLTPGWDTI